MLKNGLLGSLIAVLVGAIHPASANASMIAFYADSSFVDTSREGPNLRTSIESLGHSVNEFTGTNASDFSSGLAGSWILVLPEMEVGNLNDALDNAARDVLSDFVAGGGLLIQANYFVSNSNLPNDLFGYSLSQTGSIGATNLNAVDASGTPFAGGPDPLPGSDAVEGVLTSSLPGGALNLYDDGTNTSVFQTSFGAGKYIYLGFDWFEEPTPGDWETVLGAAIDSHMMGQVPEPSTLALWSLGTVAFVGLGWRRRMRAA